MDRRKIVVILKGYPRLSETFIAQELLGLEQAGFELAIVAMRRPTDKKRHPVHDEICAPVFYLPEYLHEEPIRVLKGLFASFRNPGFSQAFRAFLRDLPRDISPNRFRRFGQAAVLAAEWPEGFSWLHAHFIHTPASVAHYASLMTGIPWSCSAHAKDIWTSPDWELKEKLIASRWTVTCTESGHAHLSGLGGPQGDVHLSYHGLDLARFGPNETPRSARDGSDPADPVRILSVGRAVEKKGFDILIEALSRLPKDLHWRFDHIGDGEKLPGLKAQAERSGIADRMNWRGARDQTEVLDAYRTSDIFALACRITSDGDRDGLPNVLVEASSQGLVCVSSSISGVPELLVDGENGLMTPPEDSEALARALERVILDPDLRHSLGAAAERKVRTRFDFHTSIAQLSQLFESAWRASP